MKYLKLLGLIIGCELIGVFGSIFTVPAIDSWYKTLNRPFFTPPDWLFGPAWTLLYLLMGVSLFLVLEKGFKDKKVKKAAYFFLVQLFLNFIWSIIFFGFKSPLFALFEIVILWLFILITIISFSKISKTAAYLMIPYLLWVTFASALNLFIVVLNP